MQSTGLILAYKICFFLFLKGELYSLVANLVVKAYRKEEKLQVKGTGTPHVGLETKADEFTLA